MTSNGIAWALGDMPHGAVEEVRVTFLADASMAALVEDSEETVLFSNHVDVEGTTGDGFLVSDADDESLPVEPQPSSIQILKWTDFTGEAAYPGAELGYHLFVVNTGDQTLTDVRVTDYLPSELAYAYADIAPVSQTPSPGAGNTAGGTVVWEIGTLQPQEGWEVLAVTRVKETPGRENPERNRAVATGTDEGGGAVRDEDVSDVLVQMPEITVEKTADRNRTRPGQVVTYRVSYATPARPRPSTSW